MSDLFDRTPGQRFAGPTAPGNPLGGADNGTFPGPGAPSPDGSPRKTVTRYQSAPLWLPIVIGLVIVAIIAGLVWFGTRPAKPSTGPTPTATTPSPPECPAPSGAQSIPFVASVYNAKGCWYIMDYSWDATGVTLTCQLTVESGTLKFGWTALDNTSSDQFAPTKASTLRSGSVAAGDTATGTVRFDKNQGDTEIILTDARGIQITALGIKG
jgi:hypothetical protein